MTALLVAAAIAATGSEDYAEREAGSRTVARLVRTAPARFGPPVAAAATLHPCPETRSRCHRVLAPYRDHVAAAYVPPCRVWPCLDWGTDAGLIPAGEWHHWYGRVPCDNGPEACGPTWSRYRKATEDYVRDRIRTGHWSYADADDAVRRAWAAELELFMRRYPDQVAAVEGWSR